MNVFEVANEIVGAPFRSELRMLNSMPSLDARFFLLAKSLTKTAARVRHFFIAV